MAGIMPSVPHSEPFNGSAAIKQPFQAPPPFYIRQEARGMGHTGGLNSSVMGRTDHLPIAAPAGSHVIPAMNIPPRKRHQRTKPAFARHTKKLPCRPQNPRSRSQR